MMQRLKVLIIYGDGIAAQLTVQPLGALAVLQLPEQGRTLAIGNVDGVCILVDEMECLRHRPERKFTALDALRKCLDNALLIQRVAGQTAQTVKIA